MSRMQSKLFVLGAVLVLSALVIGSCTPATTQPTEVVATVPVEVTPHGVVDMEFVAARDAALAHLAERYGELAPPSGLAWATEPITLKELVESKGYQYTTDDWVVTATYPTAGPRRVVYRVRVANEAAGFRWEGHVDGEGRVSAASDDVLAARDSALNW